jgi:signal transduction histidine kinase
VSVRRKGSIVVANAQRIQAYGIALVATALAVLVRDLLTPLWGFLFPFITFHPAVMIASWYGGLGPGLFATSLATFLSLHLYMSPAHPGRLPFPDALALFIFALINMLIAGLCEKLHQAVRNAETDAALLKQSEEQMREAEKRKDEFLAMLGHELRNPLNNLNSSMYLLRSRSNEEDVRELSIKLIDRQTQYINRSISDLLDISRIGQGKLQLTTERLDLRTLARETTEDFCRSLQKDLMISIKTLETPVWVKGDRTRIAQMLTNLLQNAAKFTNSGGDITVAVSVDSVQQRANVSVADNGVGIDPELLQQLFSLYTQGDRTLARTEGGLGLGLAIVKSLAELHGGNVEAFSAGNGRGSEFRFSIPLAGMSLATTTIAQETTIAASEHSQRRSTNR